VKLFGLAFGQDRSFDIYLALSPMANLKRNDLIGHLEKQLPTMMQTGVERRGSEKVATMAFQWV
jgi:hypothetical protein